MKCGVFSVKILAVSALHDFYGLENILQTDDDTVFVQPARGLFDHDKPFATSKLKYCPLIFPMKNPKNWAKSVSDFERLKVHTGYQGSVEDINEISPCGGTSYFSSITDYTDMWLRVFGDEVLAVSKSQPISFIDQVASCMWIVAQSDFHVFDPGPYGETHVSEDNPHKIKRKYMNPVLWHYANPNLSKPLFSKWLRKVRFNQGRSRPYWST